MDLEMRAQVTSLDPSEAKAFCLRLWYELTIAGRAIWSDDRLSSVDQLNSLKWLSEIQHRVWGAYASSQPNAMATLLDQISGCERVVDIAGERVEIEIQVTWLDVAHRKMRITGHARGPSTWHHQHLQESTTVAIAPGAVSGA